MKSHYFLALTLANMGRIAEALEALNHAIEMARRNGAVSWLSKVPNCLGWIHRELQDFEGALAFDRDGDETSHHLGVGGRGQFDCQPGHDQLCAGDKEGLLSAMKSVESILSGEAWFRWRFEIRLQAVRAEHTLSRSEASSLLGKATRCRVRKYMVVGHTLLARIALAEDDAATAEAQLDAATGILRDFPAPLAAWKTYAMLGRLQAQARPPRSGSRHVHRSCFDHPLYRR